MLGAQKPLKITFVDQLKPLLIKDDREGVLNFLEEFLDFIKAAALLHLLPYKFTKEHINYLDAMESYVFMLSEDPRFRSDARIKQLRTRLIEFLKTIPDFAPERCGGRELLKVLQEQREGALLFCNLSKIKLSDEIYTKELHKCVIGNIHREELLPSEMALLQTAMNFNLPKDATLSEARDIISARWGISYVKSSEQKTIPKSSSSDLNATASAAASATPVAAPKALTVANKLQTDKEDSKFNASLDEIREELMTAFVMFNSAVKRDHRLNLAVELRNKMMLAKTSGAIKNLFPWQKEIAARAGEFLLENPQVAALIPTYNNPHLIPNTSSSANFTDKWDIVAQPMSDSFPDSKFYPS